MEVERYENGVPSWVDLGAGDLAQAREFYGSSLNRVGDPR